MLLTVGYLGSENPLLDAPGVEQDGRSNAKAEYDNYYTSTEGIFAAGDARRGQSLVVWAINEGRGVGSRSLAYGGNGFTVA